jgi:hypothetical protein
MMIASKSLALLASLLLMASMSCCKHMAQQQQKDWSPWTAEQIRWNREQTLIQIEQMKAARAAWGSNASPDMLRAFDANERALQLELRKWQR